MRLGILSAMEEEMRKIIHLIENPKITIRGSRKYFLGKIGGVDVVLANSRIGKVAAAITATTMIEHFEIDTLFFTGAAGSHKETVRIGDIVIAKSLFQHDMDASPLFPKHEIPLTGTTFFETDSQLRNTLIELSLEVIEEVRSSLSKEEISKFNLKNNQVHEGTIASGDKFINSFETAEKACGSYQVLGFEMEGASVAQVCSDYSIPFAVVRSISDNACSKSHVDFSDFIENVASEYSVRLVYALTKKISRHQKVAQEVSIG